MSRPAAVASGPGGGVGREFPRFSEGEYARRWTAVRGLMERAGVDALLVHSGAPGPVHWLSGYLPRQPTWLLVLPGEPVLLLHFLNHVPTAQRLSVVPDVRCYWPSASRAVTELLGERGCAGGRIGVVGLSTSIPAAQFDQLRSALPDAEFTDLAGPYDQLRWIRSEEELDWFRASGRLLDEACDVLVAELRPGLTEHDVEALLHASFLPRGGHLGIAFIASTAMADPDRISPWQFATGRRLERGDVVITEITISWWGYGAQIHRPFAIGSDPTPLYRDLFAAASAGFGSVCAALRDGATSEDVLDAAAVIEEAGFDVFDSVVHGEGGKNPELGTRRTPHHPEPWTFAENQVVIVQPNPVTRDRTAGLQAGCAVRVGRDRAEPLHGWPLAFPTCAAD
ncbi:aminopeptidase P family protein [Geodermatophilus sabuli]|uniref:Aminopeptidase P family protein n=1 Tax=Geodermatophilus sabuli TaxID=1564158 RepID=A0A7K3W044_9ACTN|nr:aminopeptidase P family protein [Geodermatophilus sabuli]